jgi:hypothetical protein
MLRQFRLLAHEHSFRMRPHSHTSYASLFFSLILTTTLVAGVSYGAQGAVQNPQQGSVGLTGRVSGPPPTQAAVITSPRDGDRTSSSPITIKGSCPNNTVVFVNKNGVLGGQASCDAGSFSLQMDLFGGLNSLVAQVVDGLGQYGPDSSPVTITYDLVNSNASPVIVGRQLFIESPATVVGGEPSTSLTRNATIVGGTAPYAVSWDWGDGTTSLATVAGEGRISASHSYASAGTYRVIVQVSDSAGNAAFIQLITVVNGPVAAVSGNSSSKSALSGRLIWAWPGLILSIILVFVFWLGERRGRDRLIRRQRLALVA